MGKLSKEEIKDIKVLLMHTAYFNEGAGLIVPPYLCAILKENDIKDLYTEQKQIPYGKQTKT